MDIFNIIASFLSTFEKKVYKLAKIQPVFDPVIYFNHACDIETGLYYGADRMDECRITIVHPLNEREEYGFL
jgi:hypothetical protein